MKNETKFIQEHPSHEPLTDKPCTAAMMEEYVSNDAERANNNIGQVIYDSVDISPFYENTPGDMYIEEKEMIELV